MNDLHLRVASCPSEPGSRSVDGRVRVRLGPMVGPLGRRSQRLGFQRGGACRRRLNIGAVVSAVTAVVIRRRRRALRDRISLGSIGRNCRRFEFIRQDELSEFGSSGVTLGGDVHVGRVGPQEPGREQGEGDAAPAAVNLRGENQALARALAEVLAQMLAQTLAQVLA